MSETAPTRVRFPPEAAERMWQLKGEVQSRLKEMARITARVLGKELEPGVVPRFVPVDLPSSSDQAGAGGVAAAVPADDPFVYVEIHDLPGGGHRCVIFCPGPADGVFADDPCGSGPLPCPP
jgi:hypothetical protein